MSGQEYVTLRMQLGGGSCTGMFWRGDPISGAKPPNQDNWPRNGSILRGSPVEDAGGEMWLKVDEIQQAGSKGFVKVPSGCYIPYDYDGPLLHDDV